MKRQNIKDLLKDKISKTGKSPSKAIEYQPLKLVKTFTTTLTKDFKVMSELQPSAVGVYSYDINLPKGAKVQITEFFNGRTIYVINGDKWYESKLKAKKELKEIFEGNRERPKNWSDWVNLGFQNPNPTEEQIKEKIDEPIKLMGNFFSLGKTLTYDYNKNAFKIDKSYLASNSKLGFGDPIKNKKWLVYGLIAVAGYFAYKKFKK
tara:strand:+ start:68 stop:685 length:618 start_codon:yes stop_codon:yes gene_type:complete